MSGGVTGLEQCLNCILCSRTGAGSEGKQPPMYEQDRNKLSYQPALLQKTHSGWSWRREQRRGEAGREGQKQGARGVEKTGMRTGEVDQQLRTGSVLTEDLSLLPSTLVWQLTTTSNSGSRGVCILFWPPGGTALMDMLTPTH